MIPAPEPIRCHRCRGSLVGPNGDFIGNHFIGEDRHEVLCSDCLLRLLQRLSNAFHNLGKIGRDY